MLEPIEQLYDLLKEKKEYVAIAIAAILVAGVFTGILPVAKQYSVIVDKEAQWVLFQGEQLDSPGDGVSNIKNTIKQDFENQGWQIVKTVKCGKMSYAADSWSKFKGEYKNSPALCVIGGDQTPVYTEGAKFWGGYFFKEGGNTPGTVSYIYKGDKWVIGNDGNKWDNDDVALVKFLMDGTRPLIIIWTGDRFDTGNLKDIQAAWRWVAAYGANHQHNWYIFNDNGYLIDHEITLAPPPPVTPPEPGTGDEPPEPDLTAPSVRVVFPTKYAEVRNNVTIRIEASDSESGIAKLEVYIKSEFLGNAEPTETPNVYTIEWNTKNIENGNADISVLAKDYAGNSVQIVRWVIVNNPGAPGEVEEVEEPPPPATTEERIANFISTYKWYFLVVLLVVIIFAFMGFKIIMKLLDKIL